MALKLAIADRVGVNIEGFSRDENGNEKPFKFVLVCDRLDAAVLKQRIADKGESIEQFFEAHAHDWRGQTLVTDDADMPAPFSVDALRVLFKVNAMSAVCWHAYLIQVGANAKN